MIYTDEISSYFDGVMGIHYNWETVSNITVEDYKAYINKFVPHTDLNHSKTFDDNDFYQHRESDHQWSFWQKEYLT